MIGFHGGFESIIIGFESNVLVNIQHTSTINREKMTLKYSSIQKVRISNYFFILVTNLTIHMTRF